MQTIEAALAFAVTMLVLSIVCSALVETIHRTFGMREAGYRKMLGELFDYVLTTYAQSESKEQFQARMSSFRCPLGVASSVKEPPKFTSPRDKAYESVATLWRGRGLSGQTTAAFMEKLGTSPIGKDLVSKVEDAAGTKMGNAEDEMKKAVDRTLQDVAQKFEAFGEEASAFFQRRARILSIIVAIIVAFVLHVDAIDLFSTLLRDPNSRAAVLATQDNALKWAKRAEAEIAKLESSTPASADIKTAAEDLRKAESDLRDLGVPIAWTDKRIQQARFWAWLSRDTCEAPGAKPTPVEHDKQCANGQTKIMRFPLGVPTDAMLYLGLLLGGLLIGLGAPFWSDVISNVTNFRASTFSGTTASSVELSGRLTVRKSK